jgi:molybdenum cofactor biosynthesis enzyme MoaA
MNIETFSILAGTKICDAACPFCISHISGILETGAKIPKVNWRNFDKACRLAQINGVSTVLITGKGEPTLYPNQITEFLENLEKYNFPLLEIQTNGIRLEKFFDTPFKNEEGATLNFEWYLKKWYSLGLNTISISVVHYDKEKNKSIYTPKNEYMDLENLIEKLHNIGYSVRLSCVIMKDYIDNVEEVKKMISFAKNNKVEQLTLRKITSDNDAEELEIKQYCDSHLVPNENLNQIINFLNTNGKKLMTLPHGAVIYDVNKQNVCLTDCIMINPEKDDIRTLIFFPDGHLRYNWEYGGAILL